MKFQLFLIAILFVSAGGFAQTTGTLTFSCNTYASGGNWDNKHVLAVWIQNKANPSIFIKTNAKYGSEDDHLTSWVAISNKNIVDAVTGATIGSYTAPISISWDGTNKDRNVVLDGDYAIYIEMGWGRDKTAQHAVTSFDFTKSTNSQTLSPTGTNNYSNVQIEWTPTITLLNSLESAQSVCYYSNPNKGVLNLNFYKELTNAAIVVTDMSGKQIYSDHQSILSIGTKTLNLGNRVGVYLISIRCDEGIYNYKVMLK